METFSALLALCVGNSPVTDEFPSQRPVTGSFGVFFDREAGDLRRHRAHYDFIVMAHIDGLMWNCSVSIALAMEILQSCTKTSI